MGFWRNAEVRRALLWHLTAAGIGEERLRMEDRSTTTRENLIFSDELTGCAQEPMRKSTRLLSQG